VLVKDDKHSTLTIHVANDGALYKNRVIECLKERNSSGKIQSVLLLVPLRLGVDTLNCVYFPVLKKFFSIENNCGIAGYILFFIM
jgi:hypothetical protein